MNVQEFVTKVAADRALTERMFRAADANEAYAIAKEIGLTEDFDIFVDSMKRLNAAADEMTAKDMDIVIGGVSTSDAVTEIVGVTTFCVTVAAATSL